MHDRPYRSALYIPGSKDRALDKARDLPVDVILFDLEDAVAPDAKIDARATLKAALGVGGYGSRLTIVRINGLASPWGFEDAAAILTMSCDAVLLPKVNGPADIDALAALIPDKSIWAMIETPAGILSAAEIAAHPRVAGLVLGTNDLAKDLNSRSRVALMTALQMSVLAAKAAGIIVLDGVYNAFKDDVGLATECAEGRDMGFDGKTLIHPAQIVICNAIYGPSETEIDLANRQISAFEAATDGVVVVDRKIVENLHIVTAKAILAKAAAIAALEVS